MLNSETLDWKGLQVWQKIWSGSRSKVIPFLNLLLLVLPMHNILRSYLWRIPKHSFAIFTISTLLIQLVVEWLGKRLPNTCMLKEVKSCCVSHCLWVHLWFWVLFVGQNICFMFYNYRHIHIWGYFHFSSSYGIVTILLPLNS